jgi:hypothetical protein
VRKVHGADRKAGGEPAEEKDIHEDQVAGEMMVPAMRAAQWITTRRVWSLTGWPRKWKMGRKSLPAEKMDMVGRLAGFHHSCKRLGLRRWRSRCCNSDCQGW